MPPVFRAPIGPDDAPALIAVHDACRDTDRVITDLSFEYLPTVHEYRDKLSHSDPQDWIIVQSGDEIVGYGHTLYSWQERTETSHKHIYLHLGWVKPAWRNQDIGRELLARLEVRCREKREQDGATNDAEFAANASSTEDNAQRLLRRSGYYPIYTGMEMRLAPTQPLVPSPLPTGLTLRSVLPEHHRALWQCIGDAYYVHGADNRGRQVATEDDFHRYFNRDADPSLWFAAWEQSRIAGVVLCRVTDGVADVYEVSVAHQHRRRGLARALLTIALTELLDRSVSQIRIVTWRENPTAAWRLYEAVGFETIKEFPRWRKPLP